MRGQSVFWKGKFILILFRINIFLTECYIAYQLVCVLPNEQLHMRILLVLEVRRFNLKPVVINIT